MDLGLFMGWLYMFNITMEKSKLEDRHNLIQLIGAKPQISKTLQDISMNIRYKDFLTGIHKIGLQTLKTKINLIKNMELDQCCSILWAI
jgi:hypothetical protein